jgi:hypothetical protein
MRTLKVGDGLFLRLEARGEFNFFYYLERKCYFNTTEIGEVRMMTE